MAKSKKTLRLLLASCAALWCLILPSATAAAAPVDRPNFLHILTDDQTIDSLRYMKQTSRLLKRKGTRFTSHHAVQPLCCPSRASFLSGQYPHNHGVLANLPPYGWPAMDFENTLYTSLHDAGYRTGWIGKVLNADGPYGIEPEPGFDEWLVPVRVNEGMDMFHYTLSDNGNERQYDGVYQNDLYAERARRFIAASGERPFMLTVAAHSPHWSPSCKGSGFARCPPQPDPQDRGDFRGAKFPFGPDFRGGRRLRSLANRYWQRELESLQSVDRIVASLVSQLRAAGELDDTYVIFQSDNGLLHGERGLFAEKNLPWDRSVRVPLVIRGPGFRAGASRRDLTANVDVPATILDAAGVAPPLPPDGHSLLSRHRRRFLLLERLVGSRQGTLGRWRQIKSANGWAFWRDLSTGRRRLYNLRRDPHQVRDQVRQRPRLARRLDRRMRRIADCAAPCP